MKQSASTGDLLIAEPFMQDANFKRKVILLSEVHENGAVGFILNKPIPLPFNDLVEGFDEFNPTVYLGGPVQHDTLHYIHSKGDLIAESKEITTGLFWGGNFEQIKTLINQHLISQKDIKFFLGYSGWDSGQLKEEIEDNAWVITNAKSEFVMEQDTENLWRDCLIDLGGEFANMANYPENPQLN